MMTTTTMCAAEAAEWPLPHAGPPQGQIPAAIGALGVAAAAAEPESETGPQAVGSRHAADSAWKRRAWWRPVLAWPGPLPRGLSLPLQMR